MADGRTILAAMIGTLEGNKAAILEKVSGSEGAVNEILQGYAASQKKFYVKTQGGAEAVAECQKVLDEFISELGNNGPELMAKYENFVKVSKETIHIAITTVIRMT